MKQLLFVLFVLAIGTTAMAQPWPWTDGFNYPAGTVVGNWVEFSKDWSATGTEAMGNTASGYAYMTQPKVAYRDGVVQCKVTYNSTSTALQLAGVAFRANNPGSGNGADLLHLKFQGSNGFNRVYLYENSVSGSLSAVSVATTLSQSGIVRLIAIDQRVIGQVDIDLDGTWDYTLTKTVSLPAKAGPVGLVAYGPSLMDNYMAYNAAIVDQVGSQTPSPGNTIAFDLRGRPNGPFQAALSFGNTGISLGAAGTVPLTFDALCQVSLMGAFPGFAGTLNAQGDGVVKVRIPKIPALSGIKFYCAFINLGPIDHISNDHLVTIL